MISENVPRNDAIKAKGESTFKDESTSEIAFEPKNLGLKSEKLSIEATSENVTWNIAFSQDEFGTGISSTRSETSKIRPKKRSLDFKNENLNFEDVFTIEKFSIDGSAIFSTFAESPNSLLLGTDKKKLYRFKTSSNEKEVLFDSILKLTLDGHYIYDIKKDFEGRIAIADSDYIYLLTGENDRLVSLGSYSSCRKLFTI